eukprot:EG_transcript_4291
MAEVAIRLQATCKVNSLEAAARLDEEAGGTGFYGGLPIEVVGLGLYKDLRSAPSTPKNASALTPPSPSHAKLATLLANVPNMGALPSLPGVQMPATVRNGQPASVGGKGAFPGRTGAKPTQMRSQTPPPPPPPPSINSNTTVSTTMTNTKDGDEETKTSTTVTTTRTSASFPPTPVAVAHTRTASVPANEREGGRRSSVTASPKSAVSTTAVRVTVSEPKAIAKHTFITTRGDAPAEATWDNGTYSQFQGVSVPARRFSAPSIGDQVAGQGIVLPPKQFSTGTTQQDTRRHSGVDGTAGVRAGPKPLLRSSGVRSLDEQDMVELLAAEPASSPPRIMTRPVGPATVVGPPARGPGPPGQSAPEIVPAANTGRPLFPESAFKRYYVAAKAPQFPHQLLDAVHTLIFGYAALRGIEEAKAEAFFRELQDTAFTHVEELLSDIESAAGRIWTSPKRMQDREFCFILNEVIRNDIEKLMPYVATITRAINLLLVNARLSGGICGVVYRGGGLPNEHRDFFAPQQTYRVPMFLATSVDRNTSIQQFCRRAALQQRLPPVLWVVHLDQKLGCKHVNHLKRSECEGEEEYLFSPYSVFTVQEVAWKAKPTWQDPHVVHLLAAADNRLAPETLPLAPWA